MILHHPRSTWQDPKTPVTGPKMNWGTVVGVAIHYTAAVNLIDGDPGENDGGLPAYMRAIQREYLNRKTATTPAGYSIGYNFAVDYLGGIWEARGFDIKCAAHAPLNEEYNAILMLVDGADRCTDLAAASVRSIIAEMEVRAGRQLDIRGHGQLPGGNPTACPGAGLRAQVAEGVFSPRAQHLPDQLEQPPAPEPIEGDDMQLFQKKGKAAIWFGDGHDRLHVQTELDVWKLAVDNHLPGVNVLDETAGLHVVGEFKGGIRDGVLVGAADPGDV